MKKFTISSDVLKPALKTLGQAVYSNTTLPTLLNILCRITKNQAEFITSDLELTISEKCEVEATEDFELLLPFEWLKKYVALVKNVPITIEHPSARKAKLICGEDVFELNSLEKLDSFPKVPEIPKKKVLALNDGFILCLSRALSTVSTDDLKPALTRVCLDIKPTEMFVVSSDAHMLYKHRIEGESGNTEQLYFTKKMISAIELMSEAELSWTSVMIAVKGGNTTVWSLRHNDKFPDYNVIIPALSPNLKVDKHALITALNKCCLSSLQTRQTDFHLKEIEGKLHLVTDDPDFARKISVSLTSVYTGDVEKISFNAKNALTVLSQMDGDEITLHIASPSKAALVTSDSDPDYLGLIMPLLIS